MKRLIFAAAATAAAALAAPPSVQASTTATWPCHPDETYAECLERTDWPSPDEIVLALVFDTVIPLAGDTVGDAITTAENAFNEVCLKAGSVC